MARNNEIPYQIFKLAKDLKLRPGNDPVKAIFDHCESQIKNFLADMDECASLSEMLDWVASKLGTTFRIIRNDTGLSAVKEEFLGEGEKCFANLSKDLSPTVFGITYRRLNAQPWAPKFVSVIDCRGDKAARSYFTKWHEIAHLLTLTQQLRLVFRRTHNSISGEDPEERLMDRIAGRFGFYSPVFHKLVQSRVSFFEIERLRSELCPESSSQAAIINFVKYWPSPCIFVKAEMEFNNREKRQLAQGSFDFLDQPQPVLRATWATANEKAQEIGFRLFENMRVPETSVIVRTHQNGGSNEAVEDMCWWAGRPAQPIRVEARLVGGAVEALITPE